MTLSELKNNIITRLSPVVGTGEATAMSRIILEDVAGLRPVDTALYPHRIMLEETVSRVNNIVDRVIHGEPLQYILGTAVFHGLRLHVNNNVLIPRPETSALIDIIVEEMSRAEDMHFMDVGTGSGAIAVALAREFPFANITAIDISQKALEVAKNNSSELGLAKNITFEQRDILNQGLPVGHYDVIVSNPPYVTEQEKSKMDNRVLLYEPGIALFVPNDKPLLFYEAISRNAIRVLKPKGRLFFEINPMFSTQLSSLLYSLGYDNVNVIKDFAGKNRYITAHMP